MEPVSKVKCVVGLYFETMMLVCYIDFPNIYFQPGLGIFPYQQPDLIDRLLGTFFESFLISVWSQYLTYFGSKSDFGLV